MPMTENVIITCALTGAGDTVRKSPHVPVTPEQIARNAVEAAAAGAAVVELVGVEAGRSTGICTVRVAVPFCVFSTSGPSRFTPAPWRTARCA